MKDSDNFAKAWRKWLAEWRTRFPSDSQAAHALGVSRMVWVYWTLHKRPPSLPILLRIRRKLGPTFSIDALAGPV